jgi:flagellar hook-basal body complex protein FliE
MDVTAVSSIGNLASTVKAGVAPAAPASATGPSFTQLLSQLISQGVNTIQNGEAAAIQGLTGAAPPFKVVEAVMEGQRTLQEGLSIRDKVVSAYQEIERLSI